MKIQMLDVFDTGILAHCEVSDKKDINTLLVILESIFHKHFSVNLDNILKKDAISEMIEHKGAIVINYAKETNDLAIAISAEEDKELLKFIQGSMPEA